MRAGFDRMTADLNILPLMRFHTSDSPSSRFFEADDSNFDCRTFERERQRQSTLLVRDIGKAGITTAAHLGMSHLRMLASNGWVVQGVRGACSSWRGNDLSAFVAFDNQRCLIV